MVDGRLVLVVVLVYARWNTYVSDDDDDDLGCSKNASNSLSCVMLRTRYGPTPYGV